MTATGPSRAMHLGVFASGTGNHIAGWRLPGANRQGEDIAIFQKIAATAERGKFDMVFVSDSVAAAPGDHPSVIVRLEPFTVLSALSVTTRHVGLVGTASTTYCEPYNLARMFSSLDHISGGRAGWNVVTSANPQAAANFGRDEPVDHDLRYRIAAEFVDIVRGLWDSWEDGARIADRATGVYMDTARVHVLGHKGEFYSVAGPLNSSRPPQGHPVLVQAGSSSSGQAFAASTAEVMFTVQQDIEDARRFYAGVKRQVAEAGRDPDHCKILPGFVPIVGRTEAEARGKLAELMHYVDETSALKLLSSRLGHDMSKYPLDGPVPELPLSGEIQSYAAAFARMGRRPGVTLRDVYNIFSVARGYVVVCGTPAGVADTMEEWFTTGAADGFIILPPTFPTAFDDFVDLAVPELQRRGLFREDYAGATLRAHLGLPRPPNRFTTRPGG